MRPLLGWTLAGAVGPAVGYALLIVITTVTQDLTDLPTRLDALPMALGALFYLAALSAMPGAVAGILTGVVDAVLRARVARVERSERRRPALSSATVIWLLGTGYVLLLMAITPSTWSPWPAVLTNIAVAAAIGLAPAAVAFALYLRLPHQAPEATSAER
ncbi:hypothetical protein [Isoptericola haloaureus]|uniref:Uncharacterized protein n=1 Tax=Isoptericola haloaureus TaxID=1542902 RepID=A0ABU7Z5P7_9MICO